VHGRHGGRDPVRRLPAHVLGRVGDQLMQPLRLAALLLALAAAPAAQQLAAAPQNAPPPAPAAPATPPAGSSDGRPVPALGAGAGVTGKAFAFTAPDRFEFHARSLSVADDFAEQRSLVISTIVVDPHVVGRLTDDHHDGSP